MSSLYRPLLSIAAALLLGACQSYVDAQGRTHLAVGPAFAGNAGASGPVLPSGDPGRTYVSDADLSLGVRVYRTYDRRGGTSAVRPLLLRCANGAARGLDNPPTSVCFATDVAAFMVTVSQNRARGVPYPPDMNIAAFQRRFGIYQQAMQVPPAQRQQVEDSVFQRVAAVLGAGS